MIQEKFEAEQQLNKEMGRKLGETEAMLLNKDAELDQVKALATKKESELNKSV